MYANLDGFNPAESMVPVVQRSELDRWILARLHELTRLAREEMSSFDVGVFTRQVDTFVDDLSNWYIRRSRRRFWKSESDSDKLAAYSTLYEVLVTLAKLIAPVMPFLAEHLYQNLVRSNGATASHAESIHHCPYPEVDESLIDRQLLLDVALTQRVVSLGRAARNKANVKVRQPLRRMLVRAPSRSDEDTLKRIAAQVTEELNVKEMVVTTQVGELITYVIKPNFALLGPKYGNRMGAIRTALTSADPAAIAAQVEAGSAISLTLEGESNPIELLPAEVQVETREREGFAVTQESGLVVALDTELDDELLKVAKRREGNNTSIEPRVTHFGYARYFSPTFGALDLHLIDPRPVQLRQVIHYRRIYSHLPQLLYRLNNRHLATVADIERQHQAPVTLARDIPIAHVREPVLHPLARVLRYPFHFGCSPHHAWSDLLHADVPLGRHSEDKVGVAAPADRVAVGVVLQVVQKPLLTQRLEDRFGHIGDVLPGELSISRYVITVLIQRHKHRKPV
jgi:hypothetical protein